MMRSSLRQRLAVAGIIAVVISLVFAAWGLSLLFAAHVERRAAGELETQINQLIAGIERSESGELTLATPLADPRFNQPFSGLYWQIATREQTLRSRSLWDQSINLPSLSASEGLRTIQQVAGPAEQSLIAVARSVVLPPSLGSVTITALVASERQAINRATRDFTADLMPYIALLAAIFLAAGWLQLRVGLRPLAELSRRLTAVRSGEAERLGTQLPEEVRPLASDFDALIDARETELEAARKRAGDLAHGLKTPLQALLSESERLHERHETASAQSLESIVGTMQRHVDRELTRARVATRAANASSNTLIVCQQVVSVVERTPSGAVLDWAIRIEPTGANAMSAIDAADLAEALGALIENAARHARQAVCLAIDATMHNRIDITIQDDGPGLPDAELTRLMDRGARLDESGPGTGLGLAIAREIAEGAGGALVLQNAGSGLIARLSLPRAKKTLPSDKTRPWL